MNRIFLVVFLIFGISSNLCSATCEGAVQESNSDSPSAKLVKDKSVAEESAASEAAKSQDDTLIYSTDFDGENSEWSFTDSSCWKKGWTKDSRGINPQGSQEKLPVLSLFQKQSTYKPKVRSPFHQAILNEPVVESFQLDVEVLSTHKPYGHRDVCLFFGYENESRFYYVHLGQKTDPHCNQIFLVNDADRKKISATTSEGTPWTDSWHHVRIVRNVDSSSIEVFFDALQTPVTTAKDQTSRRGKVGIGSFDDTADFRFFRLRTLKVVDDSAKVKNK